MFAFRSLIAASCVGILSGCTSSGVVPIASARAELVAEGGQIVLRDEQGRTMPIDPTSTLRFRTRAGAETQAFEASRLCRDATGFLLRSSASESCAEAARFVSFDDVATVSVENADHAAVTAIVAGSAIVVIVVVVAVIAATSKKDDSKNESEKSSSSSSSASSSSPSSSRGGSGGDVAGSAAYAAARIVEQSAATEIAERAEQAASPGIGPVFPEVEVRRSTIRGLASIDLGASAFTPSRGATSSARGGIRLIDLFDLTVGARMFEAGNVAGSPRGVLTLGIGMHGRFPRARWLALALGAEFGHGSALDVYAAGTLGLRFAPFSSLWIGVYPIHPSYAAWSAGRPAYWTAMSTADVTFAF